MADTLREKIIGDIVNTLDSYAAFSAIGAPTVERGYEKYDPDVHHLPIIAVLPRPEDAERTQYGTTTCTMPVDIYCMIKIGNSNPSQLGEAVLGELIMAALSEIPADASDVAYVNGGIDEYLDQFGRSVLTVGITVQVTYETDIGDPYTLTT